MTVITATYTQAESIFPAATSEYTAIGRVPRLPRDIPRNHGRSAELSKAPGKGQNPSAHNAGNGVWKEDFSEYGPLPHSRVRAAAGRLGSTCSKAPLAERYISGKDMVTAAMTVADQEKAILILK